MRLGVVLRAPESAASAFERAAQLWEQLGEAGAAAVACWQALARVPDSEAIYQRLRALLLAGGAHADLDRLYGRRLATLAQPDARRELLLERALHRLRALDNRVGAIQDLKRILKIDPRHAVALRHLATLAIEMQHFPQAVGFLERLLALEPDRSRAAALRLELAEAHEAAGDAGQALETLHEAVAAQPGETLPRQRLTDLLLREGDWSGAIVALRSWEVALVDPPRKAALWVRVGRLLADHGRDPAGAASAFAAANELDPLGDGILELGALHARTGAVVARRAALAGAIDSLRGALLRHPFDVPRLQRFRQLLELAARAGDRDPGDTIVPGQLLALVGEPVELPPARRGTLRGTLPPTFWSRLRPPAATGLMAEIWPSLAVAARTLLGAADAEPPPRERVSREAEPRLGWIEAALQGAGLGDVDLWLLKRSDASDARVIALDAGSGALILGRGVLAGDATARFRVGRALSLLRDRASFLDRVAPEDLGALLAAAPVVAGVPAADAQGATEETVRALGKAMGRKERRALELQASRFGFEPLDAGAFRAGVLAAADRLGLLLAGDIAVAARVRGELGADAEVATLAAKPAVLELVRFALSEDYLALRRLLSGAEG